LTQPTHNAIIHYELQKAHRILVHYKWSFEMNKKPIKLGSKYLSPNGDTNLIVNENLIDIWKKYGLLKLCDTNNVFDVMRDYGPIVYLVNAPNTKQHNQKIIKYKVEMDYVNAPSELVDYYVSQTNRTKLKQTMTRLINKQ